MPARSLRKGAAGRPPATHSRRCRASEAGGPLAARESAGILLFRRGSAVEVLLVHPGGPFWAKRDDGAWSIPKGECGEGEGLRECALRELREELGDPPAIPPDRLIELGSIRQKSGKVVHAWAVEGDFDPAALRSNTFRIEWPPRSGREEEFPEVDRAEWFEPAAAGRKILAAQAALLDRLLELLG
jgi:predicted NUDIX family NTP pyrophosphohydrolase